MSGSTRRNFLIASGAGAAAVGAAAALPATAQASAKPTRLPGNAEPLVAHIADPSSGTISLLVGEHEHTVHDPDLVARIAQAAQHVSAKEA